uniref:DUF268 domain-containing protein n=1 Tax=Ditylenchus dipsaci TaxID=166011 RepID=A0A915CKX4_9BILA
MERAQSLFEVLLNSLFTSLQYATSILEGSELALAETQLQALLNTIKLQNNPVSNVQADMAEALALFPDTDEWEVAPESCDGPNTQVSSELPADDAPRDSLCMVPVLASSSRSHFAGEDDTPAGLLVRTSSAWEALQMCYSDEEEEESSTSAVQVVPALVSSSAAQVDASPVVFSPVETEETGSPVFNSNIFNNVMSGPADPMPILYHGAPINTPEWCKYNKYKTEKGFVSLDEIEANIFLPNKYAVKDCSPLIPVLQKVQEDSCAKIYDDWQKVADRGLTMDPPAEPVPRDQFTLYGYLKLGLCYYNNTFNNNDLKHKEELNKRWTQQLIDSYILHGKNNSFSKFTIYTDSIGAVIGSQSPWVEVFCLLNGARHVYTVDYQKVDVTHPNISFVHALDLVKNYELYQYKLDFVASFSSIEHSGLGRYGDPIDPFGDVKEMQKIRCLLKPGSLFFLALPFGTDAIGFNCHRYYGRIRLAFMFAGFELVNVFGVNETHTNLVLKIWKRTLLYQLLNTWCLF